MPTRFSAWHQGHPLRRPVLLPWPRSWKGEKAETEQNKNEAYLILTSILLTIYVSTQYSESMLLLHCLIESFLFSLHLLTYPTYGDDWGKASQDWCGDILFNAHSVKIPNNRLLKCESARRQQEVGVNGRFPQVLCTLYSIDVKIEELY